MDSCKVNVILNKGYVILLVENKEQTIWKNKEPPNFTIIMSYRRKPINLCFEFRLMSAFFSHYLVLLPVSHYEKVLTANALLSLVLKFLIMGLYFLA